MVLHAGVVATLTQSIYTPYYPGSLQYSSIAPGYYITVRVLLYTVLYRTGYTVCTVRV